MTVRAARWVLCIAFAVLVSSVVADVTPSLLVVRVTTDRQVYRLRRPVHITITETNTGDHEVQVSTGCQILHGSLTRDGETVWTFRDFRLCLTGERPLPAGASRRLGMFWSGRPDSGFSLAPGIYVVHAGIDGVSDSATIRLRGH